MGYSSTFSLGDRTDDKEKQKTINVAIKNIGHGFAKTLVIHTGFNIGGLAFNKVINVGDNAYTFFVLNKDNLKYGIVKKISRLTDITNEMVQNAPTFTEALRLFTNCAEETALDRGRDCLKSTFW